MANFAVPGPRAIGFRFGHITSPGHVGALLADHRDDAHDMLEGPTVAGCRHGLHPNLLPPVRGCGCGIYAFSRLGWLVESNQAEWNAYDKVPMVGLYWGRMIPGQFGFRAEHQAIIALGSPAVSVFASGRRTWDEWLTAFRARNLPIAVCEAPTRIDMLHRMATLAEGYGTYLEDIPKVYRVPATPTWTVPLPPPKTPIPPQVGPHPNPPLNLGPQHLPLTPAQRVRQRLTKFRPNGTCQCGCGAATGPRAMFRPGHDAKHKGNLKRAARRGDQAAIDELAERGW